MTECSAIGFDTSNYTTSAAFCSASRAANSGKLLNVAAGQLGLRQNEALFQHIKQLPEVIKALDIDYNCISAIGVSTRPRRVEGSYMPCFLAGTAFAQFLADILKVPLFEFSHQEGHIAAAAYSSGEIGLLDNELLAWHLSGGTTELLLVRPHGRSIRCEIIAATSDISAGQLIDRLGLRLGCPFPAGKFVDKLALTANRFDSFKIKTDGTAFSLSGMENKCSSMLEAGISAENTAYFLLASIAELIIRVNTIAIAKYGSLPLLYSGGVSSSSLLRSMLCGGFFASPEYASDNAFGAALLAARERG